MARNIPALLLKVLGIGLGLGLDILSFVLPDATRAFITTSLGVSDLALVRLIVTLMAVFGSIMIVLILGIMIYERYVRKPPVSQLPDESTFAELMGSVQKKQRTDEYKNPQIVVELAKNAIKRTKRLRVRLSNGEKWREGRFYFVTIKNVLGPSVKDLEIHYETTCTLGGGKLMLIPPSQKNHVTVNDFSDTVDAFDHRKDAMRLAFLNDPHWETTTVLHQGNVAQQTFLLFFTLEGYPTVCIPAAESTRMYEVMPCKWDVDLYLSGDPVPTPKHVGSFHVDIRNWKSIRVKTESTRGIEEKRTIHGTAAIHDDGKETTRFKQIAALAVKWHLSGEVQPVPPFGSEDMKGSDKASTLHFVQHGDTIELSALMNRLKPSHMYHVTVGPSYTVKRLIRDDIIGGSRVNFTTDEIGSYRWDFSMDINEFRRLGIGSFSVQVNDAPCRNATVLLSDNIPIQV